VSLANVLLQGDVAWIATDTLGEAIAETGEPVRVQKAYPLTRLNAAFTGRGLAGLLSYVAGSCMNTARDFDGLVGEVPGLMFTARDVVTAELRRRGIDPAKDPRSVNATEGVLVGPSAVHGGQMQCHTFEIALQSMSVQVDQVERYVAPWVPSWGPAPATRSLEDLVDLSKRQVRLQRAMLPQAAIGGELIVLELRRDSIRSWKACDLP